MTRPGDNGDSPYDANDSSDSYTDADWNSNFDPAPGTTAFAAPAAGREPRRRGGDAVSSTLIGAIIVVLLLIIGILGMMVALLMRDDEPDPVAAGTTPETTTTNETVTETHVTTTVTETRSSTPTSRSTTKRSSTTGRQPGSNHGRGDDDDLGTGRDDVDSQGWIGLPARCDDGDRALAVVATEDDSWTVACRDGGSKYYVGFTSGLGVKRAPIIVDEGDRIVARDGAWKYQMSPDGLLVTENNVVKDKQAGTVWGRAD